MPGRIKAVYGIKPEMFTSKIVNTISTYLCSCNCQYCYHVKQKCCIFFSPKAFCHTQKVLKKHLWPGLCPRLGVLSQTQLGELMTLPQIPVGWEGGHPLSNSHSSRRLQHLNIGDFSTSCYWTTSNFCSAYVPALLGWSNSQVRPLQRWKAATMPSRLQSRNRPIFLFLSLSNFDLKPFTDFADTVSWSSMFQRLRTLSEKKWRRTSQLHRCLTSLNEWPRMSVFSSQNLVNGIGEILCHFQNFDEIWTISSFFKSPQI